ncbi:hypothetical protein C1H46_020622 [Malus baccata]|uniref:Uncharacterized protein n=1 Tax=Malus baccata TaxID=106549 RepID=A0A540M4W1_MALBA|nr:hypothetical protein C1H46_020622 [Malus baccata]
MKLEMRMRLDPLLFSRFVVDFSRFTLKSGRCPAPELLQASDPHAGSLDPDMDPFLRPEFRSGFSIAFRFESSLAILPAHLGLSVLELARRPRRG